MTIRRAVSVFLRGFALAAGLCLAASPPAAAQGASLPTSTSQEHAFSLIAYAPEDLRSTADALRALAPEIGPLSGYAFEAVLAAQFDGAAMSAASRARLAAYFGVSDGAPSLSAGETNVLVMRHPAGEGSLVRLHVTRGRAGETATRDAFARRYGVTPPDGMRVGSVEIAAEAPDDPEALLVATSIFAQAGDVAAAEDLWRAALRASGFRVRRGALGENVMLIGRREDGELQVIVQPHPEVDGEVLSMVIALEE